MIGGTKPSADPLSRGGRGRRSWGLLTPLRRRFRRWEERPPFLILVVVLLLGGTVALQASFRPLSRGAVSVAGLALLTAFVLAALYVYVRKLQPKEVQHPKNLALLAAVIVLVLFIARALLLVADALRASFPFLPRTSLGYAVPVALGGVLLTILLNPRLAFAGSIAISILASLLAGGDLRFFLFGFVGSLVGVFAVSGPPERTTFFRAGAVVAGANAYTLVSFSLVGGGTGTLVPDLLAGAANGFFVGVLATGLLPLLENLFEATTGFTLLELANPHQPILRRLILTAPGTYYHSVLVGTLAEAAAEAIQANALLCRVGAFYHDVGKMRHPAYFVENQGGGRNRHETLSPNLSSLILISHVKEGMALAQEAGLPAVVADMIPQHHGTRVVTYFYEKARGTGGAGQGKVHEEDFRYPGPKPQTKEAAILMLADAVEAASKTLADPTPARIEALVRRIIQGIFADGQLDECDLTLRDLDLIGQSFVRILTAAFHSRVAYPEGGVDDAPRGNGRDPSAEGPPEGADRHPAPQGGGRGDPVP